MSIERWPEPWQEITDDQTRCRLQAELEKEVSEGHPLWNESVKIIARRKDRDDVLVEIRDATQQYAVVHLTWSRKKEIDPRWPSTKIFPSLQEWRNTVDDEAY